MPFEGDIPPGIPGAPGGAPPMPLPQSLSAAPPQSGPAVAPSGNPGNTMQGLAKIGAAIKLLQEALPTLPMGSPEHAEILRFLTAANKHIAEFQVSPQGQKMALMQQVRQIQQASQQGALQRLAPPGMPAPPVMPDGPIPQPA